MSNAEFMAAVATLTDALEEHAFVQYVNLCEGVIYVSATVRGPVDTTLTEPADVRRAIYDRAEKMIALTEPSFVHDRHPEVCVSGEIDPWHQGCVVKVDVNLHLRRRTA